MSKNVTLIDDLPFLDEIMNSQGNQQEPYDLIPNREYNQIKKFIRKTDNNFPPESGMSNIRSQQQLLEEQQMLKQQQMMEEEQRLLQLHQLQLMNEEREKIELQDEEKHQHKKELSCINIAEHVADCIVCSKLYNNNYTIFYGIIVVLVIICLILLKRVVDK
jgi:hypothetical protein